jgi:hypothetical protein
MAYLSAKQCDLPSSTGDLISIKSGFLALGFLQNGEFIYLQVMRVSMLKMMMNHGSHWDIGVEENAEFYGSQISRPSKLPQVGDNFGRHILGVMNSLMQVRTLASYLCGVLSNENHGRFESAKDLLGGFQQTEMMGMDQISMAFLAGWSPQKLYGFMQKNTTNLGDVFLPLTTKAVPS